jgi:hypothetical protein
VNAGTLNVAYGESTSTYVPISQTNLELITTSAWQLKTYTFTTSATTDHLSIRFLGGSAGSNDTMIDEAILEKVEKI